MNLHEPLALAAILGIAYGGYACSVVGHQKVDGWPELEVHEHYVSHKDMRDRCGKYTSWATSPEACAEFDLARGRCDIWFSKDFPPADSIKEHERLHCKGFDHVGSTVMREFHAAWKRHRR